MRHHPSTRFRIYIACGVVLSAVLAVELAVVTRHNAGVPVPIYGHESGEGEARPLPTRAGSSGASHVDPRLSRIATRLGRGSAEVRCWSTADWDDLAGQFGEAGEDVTAYTTIDSRRVHLPWHTCSWLRAAPMRSFPLRGRAAALAAFAHELEHLRGVEQEAKAECYSFQHLAHLAASLGTDLRDASELARFAWREFYPPDDPGYASAECRNGGRLDLHPRRRLWP